MISEKEAGDDPVFLLTKYSVGSEIAINSCLQKHLQNRPLNKLLLTT